MTEQEYYIEVYKHISKEMQADMLKTPIWSNFAEPMSTYYFKQVQVEDVSQAFWSITPTTLIELVNIR